MLFFTLKKSKLTKYHYLKEPQIVSKQNIKVIEVPFEVSTERLKDVFAILYKTYYKTKGVPKVKGFPISKARYSNPIDKDLNSDNREEIFKNIVWKGSASIEIPDHIKNLPKGLEKDRLTARINTWNYGEIVEILHIGPYEDEQPTIKKLMNHVEQQGYVINGPHEEEYLRGPGTPFAKQKNYYTIIRYQVKKVRIKSFKNLAERYGNKNAKKEVERTQETAQKKQNKGQ